MLTLTGCQRPADGGNPTFMDHGRFAQLLSTTAENWQFSFQHTHSGRNNRTPSFVSFVGQTGHGKSTLIKLLVDLHASHSQIFSMPVVGAPGATESTSENVHLYSDPVTATLEAPLLYADCEGLLGGKREPISSKLKRSLQRTGEGRLFPKSSVGT
jgi:energy-coupling factor transporter ATP-binding protein EcfA2